MEVKPDSAPVLMNGTGTPYLAIFNALGEPIVDDLSGLPIGMLMTSFQYKYEEEKSDSGEFTLETDNPDLIAKKELDYYMGLQLQWGWIYPNGTFYCGPVRKVVITGQKVEFNDSGVHINISFSDSSVTLKNQPADYFNCSKGFEEYIKALLEGLPVGLECWDYGSTHTYVQKSVLQVVEDEETVKEKYDPQEKYPNTPTIGGGMSAFPDLYSVPSLASAYPGCVGVKFLEYNPENAQKAIDFPTEYYIDAFKTKGASSIWMRGIGRNKFAQLHELTKTLKGGPYFVDPRDDKIVIHNMQTNRPVSKVYTYKGGNGELLEFTVQANYARNNVDLSKKADVDPDTGDIDLSMTQVTTPRGKDTSEDPDLRYATRYGSMASNPNTPFDPEQWVNDLKKNSQEQGWFAKEAASRPPTYYEEQYKKNQEEMAFPSNKAASDYLYRNAVWTQEDVNAFWKQMKTQFDALMAGTSGTVEDVAKRCSIEHQLERFTVKRKVKIRRTIEMGRFGGNEAFDEAFITSIANGEYDLNESLLNNLPREAQNLQRGLELFKKLPDFKVISIQEGTMSDNTGWHPDLNPDGTNPYPTKLNPYSLGARTGITYRTDQTTIEYSVNLSVDLDGLKAITDYPVDGLFDVMGANLEQVQTNQIKANAIIVGDPLLESSMNLQIQNVSSKFEGVWYIKEITHEITPGSGYKCNIEFVQRNQSITLCEIGAKLKTTSGDNIKAAAAKAAETGSYKRHNEIKAKTLEKYVKSPTYQEGQTIFVDSFDENAQPHESNLPLPISRPITTEADMIINEGHTPTSLKTLHSK